MMKWTYPAALAVLGLIAIAPVKAQPSSDQEELIKKREAKLEKPFLKNGDWTTSFPEALDRAKKNKKLVFGYFTRSYSP